MQGTSPTVSDAVEQYQRERSHEVRESTVVNQKYHLRSFVDWAAEIELDDLGNLNGFLVNQFKTWRRENSEINDQTLYNVLMTIRGFLGWCEQRELVEDGLADKLDIPKPEDPTRNTTIDPRRAEDILTHLQKFRYASLHHVLFYLLYHTGMRIGTARALDTDDWDDENNLLHIRHRPDEGTPLKNGEKAQRAVNIGKVALANALSDYIKRNRPDQQDEYRRDPMFPSSEGRATTQTLRLYIERITQPCRYTESCPHDRTQDECKAYRQQTFAYECPSAVSPHPIRRSAITEHLRKDVPKDVVSERMNVSRKVLEQHYNAQTEEEKAELRRRYLDNL